MLPRILDASRVFPTPPRPWIACVASTPTALPAPDRKRSSTVRTEADRPLKSAPSLKMRMMATAGRTDAAYSSGLRNRLGSPESVNQTPGAPRPNMARDTDRNAQWYQSTTLSIRVTAISKRIRANETRAIVMNLAAKSVSVVMGGRRSRRPRW